MPSTLLAETGTGSGAEDGGRRVGKEDRREERCQDTRQDIRRNVNSTQVRAYVITLYTYVPMYMDAYIRT
jgi:hypothetical protein